MKKKNVKTHTQQRGLESYRRGHWIEYVAMLLLRIKGYRILTCRYQRARHEIDIVACRGRTLIVCEVKYRQTLLRAYDAITQHQQNRLVRAATIFLAQYPQFQKYDIRFDAMCFAPYTWPRHVQNAWMSTSQRF